MHIHDAVGLTLHGIRELMERADQWTGQADEAGLVTVPLVGESCSQLPPESVEAVAVQLIDPCPPSIESAVPFRDAITPFV